MRNNIQQIQLASVLIVTTVGASMEFGTIFVDTNTSQVHFKTAELAPTTSFSICCSSPNV